ncbi:DNL zinc finger-domain-containing protein [Cristinia sonorae]|uniref:DNL zinc finger-domain-containing protein n=1 Tax=Cristinia sonorae TaxID=1940300 RepID=A0A8K0UTW6_9AGAR|nr:DNL zinc finger-domain-containing protein [Cristinia sonorae]
MFLVRALQNIVKSTTKAPYVHLRQIPSSQRHLAPLRRTARPHHHAFHSSTPVLAPSTTAKSEGVITLDSSSSLPENEALVAAKVEARLMIQFTCTVPKCDTRSSHEFSKRSYEKGIVIVQCPGCKNRHLIADHLGWFKDSRTADGKFRTIEHIMKDKGEFVKRGKITNGVISYDPEP